jgi:hypothetical protein
MTAPERPETIVKTQEIGTDGGQTTESITQAPPELEV